MSKGNKPVIVDAVQSASLGDLADDVMRTYNMTRRLRSLMSPQELARLDSFDVADDAEEAALDAFVNAMAKKYGLLGSA